MRVLSIALGGCLKAEPVAYGVTEDTGGHISYVLGETRALAARADVTDAEIVTRLLREPRLGAAYARPHEPLGPKARITRIDSGDARYLSKDALAADRPAFTAALIADLAQRPVLPDLVHAHFADAAGIADALRRRFGIPFLYTAHSLALDKRAALDAGGAGAAAGPPCPALEARIAAEDYAIRTADAVIASSRDECERQIAAYPSARFDRIHRLRPGVAPAAACAAERAAAHALVAPFLRAPDRPMVLAIARPVRKKNLVALVEAFAAAGLGARANLVILAGLRDGLADGEPEQREVIGAVVDAIDRHDLHGVAAWPRRHTQGQVRGLYALAAAGGGVFANPALTEPYGLTLIEAAAAGLPVVATRHGGPSDILAELEHGLLVDPLDRTAIGAALARLLDDRGFHAACAANGRRGAALMGWDAYATGFVAIARDVIARPASAPALAPAAGPATRGGRPRRMLVSDIDNTLTGCRVGARRFARVRARDPGTVFAVATGRSLVEARRVLREWELPHPDILITSVGSEIYWREGACLVPDTRFAAAIAGGWAPDAIAAALAGVAGIAPQPDIEQRAFKRSWFTDGPARAGEVRRALAAAGLAARVVHSHGRLLDVLPERAGKAAAMRHVANRLGLDLVDVFAAGDSGNDSDMLEACPNAILVGNHAPEMRGLRGRANVYVARRGHAGGTLEGFFAHRRARRRVDAAA